MVWFKPFTYFVFFVATSLVAAEPHNNGTSPLRLCVPDSALPACHQMVSEGPENLNFDCVAAPDKVSCISHILKGLADWMVLDPEDLYIAHRFLPQKGISVISEIRSSEFPTRDHRYAAVAVIRKSANITTLTDLRGKRSCHTGFGKTAGWRVPFAHLLKSRLLQCSSVPELPATEQDLAAMATLFGESCMPGRWLPKPLHDTSLKNKYQQLCQLCHDPTACSANDAYSNYDGALKCLTEENGRQPGDVAWTKYDAVREFFNQPQAALLQSDYEFLCPDGSKLALTENPEEHCTWAKRPWKNLVLRSSLAKFPDVVSSLQQNVSSIYELAKEPTSNASKWLIKAIGFHVPTDVPVHFDEDKVQGQTPKAYLQPTGYLNTLYHPSCGILAKPLQICVENQMEFQKCQGLKMAAIGQRISPGFTCRLGSYSGHCAKLVGRGEVQLWVTDPIPKTISGNNSLAVILRETTADNQPSKYAVAVIKSDIAAEFQGSLSPLQGKRSCHGSVHSLAGFNAPLIGLREENEISGNDCQLPAQLATYFSQSCIPGLSDVASKYQNLDLDKLCGICRGNSTSENACSESYDHAYHGSLGALRCLEDDVADVAFTDNVALYQKRGDLGDLKLLCRNGTVMDLQDFKQCNWGLVATDKVLATPGEQAKVIRENARVSLLKASELFKAGGKQDGVYKMFGKYFGIENLIFDNESKGLIPELAGGDLDAENRVIGDFHKCGARGNPHKNI